MEQKNIRNFSIIAHIDHGKSTLSDRLLEHSLGFEKRLLQAQMLDTMEIERERGITIKLNAVELKINVDNNNYLFHLIDTPGHVDFTYEVSRSLAACEGVLLLVDATQGIQAQTISNAYLALENNLEIIPVINKIDMDNADIETTKDSLHNLLGVEKNSICLVSAKANLGIDQLIQTIIAKIPPPKGEINRPLKALLFDSYYDPYKGVVCFIRVFDGCLKVNDKVRFIKSNSVYQIVELGVKTPFFEKRDQLQAGDVGWFSAGIKKLRDVGVGDTIVSFDDQFTKPLAGYKKILPMIYCGLYPVDNSDYQNLKLAMEKIIISDAALEYEYETSQALGFGVRCGFLGLLHMDVIKERLEREYNLKLISAPPSVVYKVLLTNGKEISIDNPSLLPERSKIKATSEPFVKVFIDLPDQYLGSVIDLCQNFRGQYESLNEIDINRKRICYLMPLGEIIYSFFDKLKSISKGYASLNYEFYNYQHSQLEKVEIMLNKQKIDALSFISHKDFAFKRAKKFCTKLKELIPKHLFEIPIQATIGSKVIARETIKAVRKDVIAKLYGGDVSRKKKLLEKQKEGKKRLKAVGSVQLPQELFSHLLKDED